MMFGAVLLACGSTPPLAGPVDVQPRSEARPAVEAALAATAVPSAIPTAAPPVACASDADCGYAPDADRCVADPRANRQPPLLDQGIVCYCDATARRCATLRVPPVPCESDASCAVSDEPRPHPVAASAAHPHASVTHAHACRDFVLTTTCERTNICTLHRPACAGTSAPR